MEGSDVVSLLIALAGLGGLQSIVTWRVWRSTDFERGQKVAQTRLIWFVPLVGALLVLLMHRETDPTRRS